jgi:hypothetical protein
MLSTNLDDELRERLAKLPLFIDGSDGSLWPSRSDMDTAASMPDSAERHYIRLSDLLAALNNEV